MAQYCRYCAFCIQPDDYYCSLHDKFVSGKSANKCKDYAYCELGDADGSGRQYNPRRHKTDNGSMQMKMEV